MRQARGRALLCAALLAATAVPACGSGPDRDEAHGARGAITFVDGQDNTRGGQMARLVQRWNAKRGFKERVEFVESSRASDAHRAQLVATAQDFAQGRDGQADARSPAQCYDVVMVDVVWTAEFAEAGYLTPLDPAEFGVDRLLPRPVANATVNGTLYAIPARTDAGLLYYRKDLLDSAGFGPPQSWQRLVDIAREVGRANGIDGYVGQLDRYEGLTVNAMEAIWAMGGDVVGPTGVVVDSPEAKAGIRLLADGLREGWIPRTATGFDEEDSRAHFQDGQAVFMRNWPYVHPVLSAPDSPVAGRFGVAPLPGDSALGGWNLAVSPCSRHQQTARDFIRFFLENQRTLLTEGGFAPTVADLYDDPSLRRQVPYLDVLRDAVRGARNRVQTPYYDRVSGLVQESLHRALDGPDSVDATMDRLAEAMRAAIEGR